MNRILYLNPEKKMNFQIKQPLNIIFESYIEFQLSKVNLFVLEFILYN